MIYYDIIDVSEGVNITKTNASKECDVCPYWHFLIIVLSFNQMSAIYVIVYWWCLWISAILLLETLKVLIIAILLA